MISTLDMVLRLGLAALLGSIVGMERERLRWVAGLRTHMLVSIGACLFMLVSAFGFSDALRASHVVLDPSRVAAQVVSGIGFLGAGTILMRGEIVKGLTTAASLWAVAAVGLAVGSGLYVAAITATVLIMFILAGMKPLEERVARRTVDGTLRLQVSRGALNSDMIEHRTFDAVRTCLRKVIIEPLPGTECEQVRITISGMPRSHYDSLVQKLRNTAGVAEISEDLG